MYYFNSFPKVVLTNNGTSIVLTNLMNRVEIIPSLLKSPLVFYSYDIQDSDRPDIIANKYYGDSYRYWMVLYANQIIDPQADWPLTSSQFDLYLLDKYRQNAADELHIPVKEVSSSQIYSYTQSTIYRYTKTITTKDNTSLKETSKTLVIDETTYEDTTTGITTKTFADNSSVTQTITKNAQSIYDYEIEVNDDKRNINLINSKYAIDFETQLQSLLNQ